MKNKNPFKNLVLDEEEKEIEKALEKGEYKSVKNFKARKKMFEEAARNYISLKKSKKITLRVNQEDLIKIKTKAKRNNIPYQRLIHALLHQYAEDRMKIVI